MLHTGINASSSTVLWTQVGVLIALASSLGVIARRLNQPPIVGSLLAGLLAGPSVFGQIWPAGFAWFRPDTTLHAGLLGAIAGFCLFILLVALGAETDLPLIRSLGRPAASVVGGSLLLPAAAAVAVAAALPASFMGTSRHPVSFVLLLSAAMFVSSLPVIARIITEMRLTRRDVGQLSIAAATVNDVVGFVILALATALAGNGGTSRLVLAVVGLVVVVAGLATIGQRGFDAVMRRSRADGPDVAAGLAVCAVAVFSVAGIAQALGIDAALGAFLAGMVVGRSRYVPPRVVEVIRWGSDAIFAPLYFATAGLSVDVTLLAHGSTAMWFGIVLVVAVAAKFIGTYAGGRVARLSGRESAALGISLNGRGALQVILATAGLSAGILSASAFTVVILVSIISSLAVPPLLRRALRAEPGSAEEQARLSHEQEMAGNVVVRGQRLLLPTRGSANSVAAARILDLAWPESSDVTVLNLALQEQLRPGLDGVRSAFAQRRIHDECSDVDDPVDAILAEANLGYGVIAVGAAEEPTPERHLPEFIEQLLNRTPIPLLIVRHGNPVSHDDGRPIIRPRRVLVPVTGAAASRAGQEVALAISQNTGADLHLVHVVTRPVRDPQPATVGATSSASARAVADEAQARADAKDVSAAVVVREAAQSGAEIESEVGRIGADLVVLGTTVRRVGDRPFLGHTVEHVLEQVTSPTVVIVVLPDAQHASATEHVDRTSG